MRIFSLLLILTAFSSPLLANGPTRGLGNTSVIDERDLKRLDTERESEQEFEEVREEAAQNPRNQAFPERFEEVGNERQEEEAYESEELQERFKDDPFIDNQGNGATTNQ